MNIAKEDFELWLASPVTEEVFRAFDMLGQQAKQQWLEMSWDKGRPDPLMLADLKARAEVVEDFRTLTFEDMEEWLGDEKRKRD